MSDASQATEIEAVMTPQVRAWIGRTTGPLPLPEEVAASDVRRYVDATGDRNPLWLDDAAARAAGYRGRVLPPMLVIDLSWRVENAGTKRMWDQIPLPPSYVDTRNAGTEIEWIEPVYIGDRLSLRHRIVDIVARPGRRGLGVYITRETEYLRMGAELVARVTQTAVKLPKARLEAQ